MTTTLDEAPAATKKNRTPKEATTMTTTKAEAAVDSDKEARPGLGKRLWSDLTRKRERPSGWRGWFSATAWTLTMRGLVLLLDYLIVFTTVTYLIPQAAFWLYLQAGLTNTQELNAAAVALWLLPLAAGVALLVVAEVYLLRGLWRWATRRIEAFSAKRTDTTQERTPESGSKNRGRKGNNKKRSR